MEDKTEEITPLPGRFNEITVTGKLYKAFFVQELNAGLEENLVEVTLLVKRSEFEQIIRDGEFEKRDSQQRNKPRENQNEEKSK